jgi:hypothetical protein
VGFFQSASPSQVARKNTDIPDLSENLWNLKQIRKP